MTSLPAGVTKTSRSPTWPSPSRTIAPPPASVASDASLPSSHSNLYARAIVVGSTPLTAFSPSPTTWTWSPRIDELSDDARRLRGGLAGADRDRVPAALRGDHVARAELVAQRALVAREQALAEDGHERDERQPDHQRRRGRGRAARIADRVLLCEPAGRAAEPGGREADHVGERADEARRDHGEADEDAEGAAGDAEDAHGGRDVRAERAVDEPEDRQRRHDEPEDERLPRLLLHDHAAFAHCRDRRDPGRPHGRPDGGDERHERARQHRDDGGPRLEDGRGLRQLELDGLERARSAPSRAGRRGRGRPRRRRGRAPCPRARPSGAPGAARRRACAGSRAPSSAARP